MKTCARCGAVKALSEFSSRRDVGAWRTLLPGSRCGDCRWPDTIEKKAARHATAIGKKAAPAAVEKRADEHAAAVEREKASAAVYYAAHREEFRTRQVAWRAGSPLRSVWSGMRERCSSSNATGYKNYGGRGIEVCARWLGKNGFAAFEADMGERPSPKHSLDRIDNDGNYEPSNCHWATAKEQANNRRVRA